MYKLLLISCIFVAVVIFAAPDTMKTNKEIVTKLVLDTTKLNATKTLHSVNSLIIKYDQNEQAIEDIQKEINKIIVLLDSLDIINIKEDLNNSNTKSDTTLIPILLGGDI